MEQFRNQFTGPGCLLQPGLVAFQALTPDARDSPNDVSSCTPTDLREAGEEFLPLIRPPCGYTPKICGYPPPAMESSSAAQGASSVAWGVVCRDRRFCSRVLTWAKLCSQRS